MTIILLIGSLLIKLATGEANQLDFGQLYAAGAMISQGQAGRLYDLGWQTATQERVLGRSGVLPFISPPFEALFFVPLAKMAFWQAYLLWGVFNIGLWVWFARMTRDVSRVPIYQHLLACFGFFPLWLALDLGQMSLVLLVLVTLCFLHLKRGHDLRAGLILGLGLFRFQLLLPLLAVSLIQKRWRFLSGVALSGAVYLVSSILVVGWGGIWSYVQLLINITGTSTDPSSWDMPTLRCFFSVLLSTNPAWINSLSAISGLAIFYWLVTTRQRLSDDDFFAAVLFISVLVTPYAHPYDLTFALLGQFILCRKGCFQPILLALFGYPLVVFLMTAYNDKMRVLWPLVGVPLLMAAVVTLLSSSVHLELLGTDRNHPEHAPSN